MTENQKEFETLPATQISLNEQIPMIADTSLFFNAARFELAQRVAKVFATSDMVPQQFQGNIGNCLIALNLAERMKCDPFMLLQNMYIVHGKPGIEAKLAIALVNSTGKFSPLQYKYNDPKNACYAHARRTGTNEECRGTTVSIAMAKAEGWFSKKGSKWQTMPELMLMYRSAMFFARAYCPEALLVMQSREELYDAGTVDMVSNGAGSFTPEPTTEDLAAKILNGNVDESISGVDRDLGKAQERTITPEKFPTKEPDRELPPDTTIVNPPPPEHKKHTFTTEGPDPVWYDTKFWIKTKTTGFTAFCIDNAERMNEIPAGAVCTYKGKSMLVLAAMHRKWEGIHPDKPFPGAEQVIKTEVVYDPAQNEQQEPPEAPPEAHNGAVTAKQYNRRLKDEFPIEWDQARFDLGFGMIAQSEEAAEHWNKLISKKLDEAAAAQ